MAKAAVCQTCHATVEPDDGKCPQCGGSLAGKKEKKKKKKKD